MPRPSFTQQVLAAEWLPALAEQAQMLLVPPKAENTLRAYRADWEDFLGWCRSRCVRALPADTATLVLYLTELSGRMKMSTIMRRLSAIREAHRLAGYEPPAHAVELRQLLAGLHSHNSCSAPRAKRPVLVEDLRAILANLPDSLLGVRDRALLLVGFSGAFRRSELVGLDVEDVQETPGTLLVRVGRSRAQMSGFVGRTVGIPAGSEASTCPVRSLRAWCTAARITTGALFRVMDRHGNVLDKRLSGEAVALIVKRYAKRLGYDAAGFAGHSLRAGLAISAAAAGKSEQAIMNQTGLKDVEMVRRYVREAILANNAAQGLGL